MISGGEPKMQAKDDMLGEVIKRNRQKQGYTIENLANKIGITERYLYRIENDGQKPSYDVLYTLIRELAISPEEIFCPEKPYLDSEIEYLLRMLCDCDERSLAVVKAATRALIKTASGHDHGSNQVDPAKIFRRNSASPYPLPMREKYQK